MTYAIYLIVLPAVLSQSIGRSLFGNEEAKSQANFDNMYNRLPKTNGQVGIAEIQKNVPEAVKLGYLQENVQPDFSTVDVNGDGIISRDELKTLTDNFLKFTPKDFKSVKMPIQVASSGKAMHEEYTKHMCPTADSTNLWDAHQSCLISHAGDQSQCNVLDCPKSSSGNSSSDLTIAAPFITLSKRDANDVLSSIAFDISILGLAVVGAVLIVASGAGAALLAATIASAVIIWVVYLSKLIIDQIRYSNALAPVYAPVPTAPNYAPVPTAPYYAPVPTAPYYAPVPAAPYCAPLPATTVCASIPTAPVYAPAPSSYRY